LAIWAADVCSQAERQLICIGPTGLRLRHIGKTDPHCGTVQFCFRWGCLTCSARTGFRAVTSPLLCIMQEMVKVTLFSRFHEIPFFNLISLVQNIMQHCAILFCLLSLTCPPAIRRIRENGQSEEEFTFGYLL